MATKPHYTMKTCAYCGRENDDNATRCRECQTEEFKVPGESSAAPQEEFLSTKLEFETPTTEEMQKDFVTLMKCRTLIDADMIVAQLESAGISALIPDQFLMQNIAFNLNAYGYVRIQVSPKDFEAAKGFLLASV